MNAERLEMMLNNYAAQLPEAGVPERVQLLWNAAADCAGAFAPEAEDAAGMLHAALTAAAPAMSAAGSAQPLNGLLCLAEKEPALLREALVRLLADDGGDLALRQAKMQAFCERCNEKLILYPEVKRTWMQNIRSAMNLMALLRPEENYLYKSTDARYVADMVGCVADVASGALFSLAGFHELAGGVAAAVAGHAALAERIPEEGAVPQEALRRLLVADILFSAGPKKLSLFGDQPPLITTRSRAGQAAQERAVQLNVMQLQLEQLEAKLAQAEEELAALTTPDLVGQRFISPAFGEVTCLKVQGDLITLETQSGPQRLSQPECFLKGHLVPEDEALVARYAAEQAMLARRRGLHAEIINLKCAISRLQLKP